MSTSGRPAGFEPVDGRSIRPTGTNQPWVRFPPVTQRGMAQRERVRLGTGRPRVRLPTNGGVVITGALLVRNQQVGVQFPAPPPWAARRARAGLQNQPRRVRVPGCLQRRVNVAGATARLEAGAVLRDFGSNPTLSSTEGEHGGAVRRPESGWGLRARGSCPPPSSTWRVTAAGSRALSRKHMEPSGLGFDSSALRRGSDADAGFPQRFAKPSHLRVPGVRLSPLPLRPDRQDGKALACKASHREFDSRSGLRAPKVSMAA